MKRFTVMGFTEAELGFVLAAVFAALAVATLGDAGAEAAPAREALSLANDSLSRENGALRAESARLATRIDSLVAALEGIEGKSSTKRPQCWEKGLQREPVAHFTILGENSFDLNGDVLEIGGVLTRLSEWLELGRAENCVFVVRALPAEQLSALSLTQTVHRLNQHFDVSYLQ